MVRHIVLYFLKDNSLKIRLALKEKFLGMKDKIECLKDIEVGIDFLASQRSCDVALVCTFENRLALEQYIAHPAHLPVKEYVSKVAEKSVSCDYEF